MRQTPGGFTLWNGAPPEKPWEEAAFSAATSEPDAKVNHSWFRGDWWDALTLAWKDVEHGAAYDAPPPASGLPSPGATFFVPFTLKAGASRTIAVRLAWHCGLSSMRSADDPFAWPWPEGGGETYRPWYAGRFRDIEAVNAYWRDHYQTNSARPAPVSGIVSTTRPCRRKWWKRSPPISPFSNRRPSCARSTARYGDGKGATTISAPPGGTGSCTHVWNYAQSLPHLFPDLERSLRETEFGPSQDDKGHQAFRSALPIRPAQHKFYAAADGQLGGIMKVYREWRISGDTAWLKKLWPAVKRSLDYCIETWDPGHGGLVEDPHHNTYDIEFWGPDGMCSSFYLGALQAALRMGARFARSPAALRKAAGEGQIPDGVRDFQWRIFPPAGSTQGLSRALSA